ncbi:MAG: hypothetical protein ACTSU5_10130 [Promethearchaeota archaeon]
MQEYERDLIRRYEMVSNQEAYEIKTGQYVPMHLIVFVSENGFPSDMAD